MVTIEDLYNDAERFLWENYRLTLTIPIEIDDEYPEAEGWYEHTRAEPRRICISDSVMMFATDEVIYDVLRHELIHHALHVLKKPFADGCDTFEEELRKHGVKGSGVTMVGLYHLYECAGCGEEVGHPLLLKENEMDGLATHCCEAKFKYTHKVAVYDGKERVY